jgi:hypothetical protein
MIVYKAVKVVNGKFLSAWVNPKYKYCLEYKIGVPTTPNVGKVFVFQDFDRAREFAVDTLLRIDFTWHYMYGDEVKSRGFVVDDVAVLKCEAKDVVHISRVIASSKLKVHRFEDEQRPVRAMIKRFWEHRSIRNLELYDAPRESYVTSEVLPLEVCFQRKINLMEDEE